MRWRTGILVLLLSGAIAYFMIPWIRQSLPIDRDQSSNQYKLDQITKEYLESLPADEYVRNAVALGRTEERWNSARRLWTVGAKYILKHRSTLSLDSKVNLSNTTEYIKFASRMSSSSAQLDPAFKQLEAVISPTGLIGLHTELKEFENRKLKPQPDLIKRILLDFHHERIELSDWVIDALLGLKYDSTEESVDPSNYHNPEIWHLVPKEFSQTPYVVLRTLYKYLKLGSSDVLYDLGSGYGRSLIYGASVFPSVKFKGLELVKERAHLAQALANQLGNPLVESIAADVLTYDFTDGTHFYIFNSFPSILLQVLRRIETVARSHTIYIIGFGQTADDLSKIPWLTEDKAFENKFPLKIFRSTLINP